MDMGAVGGIRRVKNVIEVARHVLENTEHSVLVGSLATKFAKQIGFPDESLQTNYSKSLWKKWKDNDCQPNFWKVSNRKMYPVYFHKCSVISERKTESQKVMRTIQTATK